MYPALALMTGAFVSQWIRRRAIAPAKAIHDGLALLAVVGAGMVVALPLAAWWFLRGELWTGVVGVVLLAGGVAAWRLARQDRAFDAARVFGVTAVAGVVLVFGGLVARLDRYQHSRAILAAVRSRSDKPYLATYAKLEPSWVFYSGQTLTEYKDPRPAAELLKTNPNAFVITSDDKFRELKPALPDGTGVVATVPYFGGKGTLLVVGRTGSSDAAVEAANASSTASPVRSATE
jgi:hypothetical protein